MTSCVIGDVLPSWDPVLLVYSLCECTLLSPQQQINTKRKSEIRNAFVNSSTKARLNNLFSLVYTVYKQGLAVLSVMNPEPLRTSSDQKKGWWTEEKFIKAFSQHSCAHYSIHTLTQTWNRKKEHAKRSSTHTLSCRVRTFWLLNCLAWAGFLCKHMWMSAEGWFIEFS